MDLHSIQKLNLVTVDGQVLGLDPQKGYDVEHDERIRIYQEICPIHLLVGSNLTPVNFGHYVVNDFVSKGAPKLFFTQMDIDVEHVLSTDMMITPITNVNPSHLKACVQELKNKPHKKTKTISLASSFFNMSYTKIRNGLWIAGSDDIIFFAIPSAEELEEHHYPFYRSVFKVYR